MPHPPPGIISGPQPNKVFYYYYFKKKSRFIWHRQLDVADMPTCSKERRQKIAINYGKTKEDINLTTTSKKVTLKK
jgi:hypothetical protein